jgi:hypothetical protein
MRLSAGSYFKFATSTLPVLKVPNGTTKLVIAFVLLDFPIAPLLAWALNSHRKGSSAQKMSISRPDAFQKPHMDPHRFDLDKRKDNWVQCAEQDLDLVRKLMLGAPSL